ncbi:MAG: hypothetical protein IJ356_08795 [Erysipelotrichaceae bacterium]|nr:hypothetical protein [Erysipelotrichaceae bacterium]
MGKDQRQIDYETEMNKFAVGVRYFIEVRLSNTTAFHYFDDPEVFYDTLKEAEDVFDQIEVGPGWSKYLYHETYDLDNDPLVTTEILEVTGSFRA